MSTPRKKTAPARPAAKPAPLGPDAGRARAAAALLLDKQADNVRIFDVRNRSGVTDFYVIGSGRSTAQLRAMFDGVIVGLKKQNVRPYRHSGDSMSGWMVVDYVDVVVHIMSLDCREYYAIEDLWAGVPCEHVGAADAPSVSR